MSRHAKQLIVQFMAACCGRSSQNDLADDDNENQEAASKELPDNELSLQRIHAIIDGMSREDDESAVSKKVSRLAKQAKEFPEDLPDDDVPEDPNISNAVKDALVATGKLWKRETGAASKWSTDNCGHSSLPQKTVIFLQNMSTGSKKKEAKKKKRKLYQEKAYSVWTEIKDDEWWQRLRSLEEPPTAEHEVFCLAL